MKLVRLARDDVPCFSGGFALAAGVDDTVVAPVMSQPSVPFPVGRKRQADVGLSPEELETVKARTHGRCVLGLRFSADKAVSPLRFSALKERCPPPDADGSEVVP